MTDAKPSKLPLAVCSGAHALQDGLSATLYVLLPLLAELLGLNYAQVGLLRATRSAATSVFELPSGLLAERFGERRLLFFGLVCAGAGYLCLSVATSLGVVLVCLFVAGVGAAFQHALCSTVVSRTYVDEHLRGALGLYNSSGDAGKLVFTGLFSLCVGAGIAWQGVLVGMAISAFLVAVVVLVTLQGHDGKGSSLDAMDMAGTGEEDEALGWGVLDRRRFGALCASIFLDNAVQSSFLVFLAFVIVEKEFSAEWAGAAVVLTLLGGVFGKAGGGFLAERMGVRRSLMIIQAATALAILVLIWAPSLLAFLVLPVLGLFLNGSSSITYGSVGDYIHADRQSRGFGLIYSIGSLSSVLGPVLFGLIGDSGGLASAMMAMAGISVVAMVPMAMLRPGVMKS